MNQAWVRSITNTCGELEREARSRRYNVIEAFGVMTFCLLVLWAIQYPFGILMKIQVANSLSTLLLWMGSFYLLVVSPRMHRDTLSSWGLGNPVALYQNIRNGAGTSRFALIGVVVALIAALTGAFYIEWPEAARFLFGIERETARHLQETGGGKTAILVGGLVLSSIFATCVIRYDNFLSALATAFKLVLILGALLYTTAFLVMGTGAFADFRPHHFALDVLGYVFWGALQQLLFSSYFGTRFRKGFAPARDPAARWKKRLAVSVLNGAFFGLIHINSWLLVLACWLLGTMLSWVFMEDRNRNLFALGCVHGFLGSSIGWLFNAEKAGGFRIPMGVGPAHMRGFDPLTVAVVLLLIAGNAFCIAYAARSWRED